MSATMVMVCSCRHEFQDKTYGQDRRVHNEAKSATKGQRKFRCTVCGKERHLNDESAAG